MRRLLSIVLLVTVASLCPRARAGDATSEADAREAARQSLNGRTAIVRLYTDWKTDPKAYATMSVPLDGLDVTFAAVKQAAGRELPQETAVAVIPGDQQDSEVARVMDGCLFGERFTAGVRLALWPGDVPPIQHYPCVFKDALGQSLANIEVEILLSLDPHDYPGCCKLWIATLRTDGGGRMSSFKASASGGLHAFLFMVNHPDCGPVPAISHRENGRKEHELWACALPRDKWCVFVDALGRPMAGATVEVVPGFLWEQRKPGSGSLPPIELDEEGRLHPPKENPKLESCCFLVYDHNYGTAIVEPRRMMYPNEGKPVNLCVVPLIPAGSHADERSLWGTVVDANGDAVAEAVIQCMRVSVPGGGSLSAWWPWPTPQSQPVKVLTDVEGRFSMHLPLADSNGVLGRPVPPGAVYDVAIDTAGGKKVEFYHGRLAAGQEHKIVLARKTEDVEGPSEVLLFHDEFGPVTDVERLKQVNLSVQTLQPGGGFLGTSFDQGRWLEKRELTPGIYTATVEWDNKLYVFGPVEVTSETPKPLILAPAQIKATTQLCYGRVVHGITGEPIADALVMLRPIPSTINAQDENLFMQLFCLGPELDPDGRLVQALREHPELGITRTDSAGRFEIAARAVSPMHPLRDSVIAIRKDFLGAEQRLAVIQKERDKFGRARFQEFEPDATGKVPLPDMKLFPAGIVIVEPSAPVGDGPPSAKYATLRYATAPGDPTPWLKRFWTPPIDNKGQEVFRKDKLQFGEAQMVYVPADVTLTLTLVARGLDPSAPVVVPNVRLRQGEVLDLGRVEFSKGIQIAVRVVDSQGKPMEGVTVQSRSEGIAYAVPGVVTDGQGVARLDVPPHSHGRLFVERRDQETKTTVREGTPYVIGGQEDEGREFVLQLSDEFLEQLRKAP